jgi:actin related protein 2/3 complex subunit 2
MFTTEGNPSELNIAITLRGGQQLAAVVRDPSRTSVSADLMQGAEALLKQCYGPMLVAPGNFDSLLKLNLDNPPEKDIDMLCKKIAGLKRNLISAAFARAFDASNNGQDPGIIQVDYRDEETVWLVVKGDRVIVVFSVHFSDPDDFTYGKVFLAEFSKLVSGAPAVDVKLGEAPMEIQSIADKHKLRAPAFVSFVLEARHTVPQKRDSTINMLFQFRTYLHYHIKCNKANLHIRMRKRVYLLLQVLNRAKQEDVDREKKTATGRTFVRKKN